MNEGSYTRRKRTYSFRAWIDEQGSNADREHRRRCNALGHECFHLELWDLNTGNSSQNIIRTVRRRRPLFLAVIVGPRYRTVLRLGRGVGRNVA